MANPIANVLKVAAITTGLLGFSELIEQCALHNKKLDELLAKFNVMEDGTRWNQPINLQDGSIKCPLCYTVQSNDASYSWKCDAKF